MKPYQTTRPDWYDAAPPPDWPWQKRPPKRYGSRALIAAGLVGFALGFMCCAMADSTRPAQTHKWETLGAGRN